MLVLWSLSAFDSQCKLPRSGCDVLSLDGVVGRKDLIPHPLGVEECARGSSADREVDVLRDVARLTSHDKGIEFRRCHADHVARVVQYRPTAATRVDRCRHLKQSAVVGRSGKATNDPRGDAGSGSKESLKGKPNRYDGSARLHSSAPPEKGRDRLVGLVVFQESKIARIVAGNNLRNSGRWDADLSTLLHYVRIRKYMSRATYVES